MDPRAVKRYLWAGDDSGSMYMLERLGGGKFAVRGPAPSLAAHAPEAVLVAYAAVALISIMLGRLSVAMWATVAVIPIAIASSVAPRYAFIRGSSWVAELRSVERVGGRVFRITLVKEGGESKVLYLRIDPSDLEG